MSKINTSDILIYTNQMDALAKAQEVLMMLERDIYYDEKKGLYRLYSNGVSVTGKTKESCLKNLQKRIANSKALTMDDIYDASLKYCVDSKMIKINTADREHGDWVKYISGHLGDRSVVNLKSSDIETYFKLITAGHNLTSKQYSNVKTALGRAFGYAKEKGYIKYNPMRDVDCWVSFAQPNHPKSTDRIYTKDEVPVLFDYLKRSYKDTGTPAYLATALQLCLGLRVGEVGALEYEDIHYDTREVYVHRQVVKTRKVYQIVNHTKTYMERYVPLNDAALEIIRMLPQDHGLLFHGVQSDLCTVTAVDRVLRNFAAYIGASKVRNSHCLRRTYASALFFKGVSLKTIQDYLGHAFVTTTERYIYNYDPNDGGDIVNPFC